MHDFAGSIVVHAVGGWLALAAVLRLGARTGRYGPNGRPYPPSSIPWLALGTWLLCIGWFGFNVMSAQSVDGVSGLVAMNSLMAMVGGILVAALIGKADPGFVHNGALAGLVAVCAGSDVFHPVGALIVGGAAGGIFVVGFTWTQEKLKIDDVLGVWPLHGLCGLWGGIACGIFGQTWLGGMGGVSIVTQILGSVALAAYAFAAGLILYTDHPALDRHPPDRRAAAPRRRPLDPLDRRQSGDLGPNSERLGHRGGGSRIALRLAGD